jgi:hypothetical protein
MYDPIPDDGNKQLHLVQVKESVKCMISVAYINDNHAMLEYGRQYLEGRGTYLVETFDTLKHIRDWIPFHTYDVIVSKEYITGIRVPEKILSVLPNDDATPVIILLDVVGPLQAPEKSIPPRQPVFSLMIRQDYLAFFYEVHQLINQIVYNRKVTNSIKSLDILLKRSELLPESTVEENIKAIVETCGRCLPAIFTAYYRNSDRAGPPLAVWHAGEMPLYYVMDDQAWSEIRPQQIKKCRISSGWTDSPDGRIKRAGKEGMFSVVMYPVTWHERQEGVLCNVLPSNHVLTNHECLMLETFSDMITWNEHMASRYQKRSECMILPGDFQEWERS